MIEKKEKILSPGEIGLNIKDTGFLLSVLTKAHVQGAEMRHAVSVIDKIESLHNYLVDTQEIIRGVQ